MVLFTDQNNIYIYDWSWFHSFMQHSNISVISDQSVWNASVLQKNTHITNIAYHVFKIYAVVLHTMLLLLVVWLNIRYDNNMFITCQTKEVHFVKLTLTQRRVFIADIFSDSDMEQLCSGWHDFYETEKKKENPKCFGHTYYFTSIECNVLAR